MKRYFWIIGLVVLVGAVAFFYYQGQAQNLEKDSVEEGIKTSKVRKGDIVITASGVGAVITPTEIQITSSTSGTIKEIFVKEGDQVKKGEVLFTIEETPQLLLDLETQRIAYLTEQLNYDNFFASLETDLATATVNYLQTQSDLDSLLNERTSQNYQRCGDDYIVQYEADYSSALETLLRLQEKFDLSYASRDPSEAGRIQMEADIANAQSKVNTTYANWQYCLSYPGQDEIDLVEAKIKIKENEVIRWKNEMEILQDGFDPSEVELYEAKLAQAKLKLEIAEENIQALVVTAPMDGTIMKVSAVTGQSVGTNANLIRIADLSRAMLEVFLDETDLDQLVIGYEAEVIFDAFDNITFKGTVVSITPELVKNGNVVYVHGLVELDPASFGKPLDLPLGLNASVDIIGGRSENTLLVPVEALRPLGDGSYAVFVLENGTPILRMVEVGLSDFTSAEILTGLKAGEEVTTGIVETIQ